MNVDGMLSGDEAEEVPAVSADDLRRFSAIAHDLADPAVLEQVWS
ncbi:hypothetical protein OHA70_06665 [Kribbella sp. NBC_00382]